MARLVLELRAGEVMIINGVSLRFQMRTRLELHSKARFLFGKQIMNEGDALTPARQVYLALQNAYAGYDETLPEATEKARALIGSFIKDANPEFRSSLDILLNVTLNEVNFDAIKIARRLVQAEESH